VWIPRKKMSRRSYGIRWVAAIVPMPFIVATAALADSAFVTQIPDGLTSPTAGAVFMLELTAPERGVAAADVHGNVIPPRDVAQALEIGNSNNIAQVDTGSGDQSAVELVGANYSTVAVVQDGNNLKSNVMLVGTEGTAVGVFQPPRSAPVSIAIIHASSGTLIIPH
jgi:hypothetical protein